MVGPGPQRRSLVFFLTDDVPISMIQAERTPNPNSIKFTTTSGPSFSEEIVVIASENETNRHELGSRLFDIGGVTDLFITPDFVTVSKQPSIEWADLKGEVETALVEYLEEH